MTPETSNNIDAALLQMPRGLFIITSAYDGMRSGLLTRWVQPCSNEPPMVMVAITRSTPIEPLLRDSRAFALCQIAAGDRLLERMFTNPPDRTEDPFVLLPSCEAPSGSPIIKRAYSWFDCEVVRHVDLEADHRLIVGQVTQAVILAPDRGPAVEVGSDHTRLNGDHRSAGTENGINQPRKTG